MSSDRVQPVLDCLVQCVLGVLQLRETGGLRPRYVIALGRGADTLLRRVAAGLPGNARPRLIAVAEEATTPAAPGDGSGSVELIASATGVGLVEALRAHGIEDAGAGFYVLAAADDEDQHAVASLETEVFGSHGLLLPWPGADAQADTCSADRLLQLAGRGLFAEPDLCEPKSARAPQARLFKSHPCRVRLAQAADLPDLLRLEEATWAAGMRMDGQILETRIANFPQGQCVLEFGGEVVGAVYSQRVAGTDFDGRTATTVHALHRHDGPIVQLLSLNIAPEVQDRAYGDLLLEFMLQYCTEMPGISTVVGITRCKDYAKHADLAIDDYLSLRNERGRLVDTVLRFHELHGAEIVRPIAGYRPGDSDNGGSGVLVRYDLGTRRRRELTISRDTQAPLTAEAVEGFVLGAIAAILRVDDVARVSPVLPLFELGLDSADLLDFNERITSAFGIRLDPSFFFEHNTCERIIAHLTAQPFISGGPRETTPAKAAAVSAAAAGSPARHPPTPEAGSDGLAIVGVACRLPGGVDNAEDFWRLLADRRHGIGRLPDDRWRWPANIDPGNEHRGIDAGGFLDDVESFDPTFFRISPREAALMDPQQRLLLQLSWACLEDAGIAPSRLAGTETGVFVGASGSDYQLRLCGQPLEQIDDYFGLGTSMAILANRLSYFYNFTGPSLQVDTACSSSLAAVHEAVKSLNAGECEQALVAGVNILCHPANSIAFYQSGMLSKSGRCRTFDAAADGYVRSEGAVVLLLRPLARAIAKRDRIYAVIKGSAVNHGGQAAGLTVPNPARQADLIRQACRAAGVPIESLGYLEAHGTGTPLGDPVEIRGMKEAFAHGPGQRSGQTQPSCVVGAVKTNIGHLEAAAGIAGLLKAALSLKQKTIPPSLNFSRLNPHITLAGSPLRLAKGIEAWDLAPGQNVRRAGVSSFGSGGANAHVILEEHVPPPAEARRLVVSVEHPAVVVLSAMTEERLAESARLLLSVVERRPLGDVYLADLAYTLQVGREPMDARLGMIVSSMGELEDKLRRYVGGETNISGVYSGNAKLAASANTVANTAPGVPPLGRDALASLLASWVGGAPVDWTKLYDTQLPRRIGLPTYPFAKIRCWIDDAPQPETIARPQSAPARSEPTTPDRPELNDRVRQNVARILGMAEQSVALDENLRTYGLDSIGAMKLQQWIEKELRLSVSGRELLELGTVANLSSHLAAKTSAAEPGDDNAEASAADRLAFANRLSEGQMGLWALHRLSPGMSAYNVPLSLRLPEGADPERLKSACRALLANNPVLGNPIVEIDGRPQRAPHLSAAPFFFEDDLRGLSDEELRVHLQRLAKEPFDLASGPLARFHLLRRERGAILLIAIHHSGFDAGSIAPFLGQLVEAYRDPHVVRQESGTTYADFVAWEQSHVTGAKADAHRAFWHDTLKDAPAALDLPIDKPRPAEQSFAGRTLTSHIAGSLNARLREFCRAGGTTPATVFLALYKVLLARYAGVDDIVVGASATVRPSAAFERLVGYFINMVPVRTRIDESQTWNAFIAGLQARLADALDHAAYPFPALVRELDVPRVADRQPVFQAAFTYQNYLRAGQLDAVHAASRDVLPFDLDWSLRQEGEYELELEVCERDSDFEFSFKFNPDLFEDSTVKRMAQHLVELARTMLGNPDSVLNDCSLLTADECTLVMRDWLATKTDYPDDACLHDLVDRQAARAPHRIAAMIGARTLTYQELSERSDALAARLQHAGVGPGSIVPILATRSLDLLVGLIGILKAGGAYVPLDPDYPADRLRYMLEDSNARIAVTQNQLVDRMRSFAGDGLTVVVIDAEAEQGATEGFRKPNPAVLNANSLAYVIYTSGSTGRPKGVMITHRALVNVLYAMIAEPGVREDDTLLAITTYGFDIAGFELFAPLLTGACCAIVPAETVRDPELLKAEIRRIRPDVMQATPSVWSMLFAAGWRNEEKVRIVCGGEPLPQALRDSFTATGSQAWNFYGPTEATIWSTMQKIAADGPITIGKPIANTLVYIVDGNMRPLPIGVAGELCIGGDGVAQGYFNRPDLTRSRFVINPFTPQGNVYKTGDLARWLPDGTIEYIGRNDGQVKLRGYRIELGEIEALLTPYPGIARCVALIRQRDGHSQLVAYYVADAPGASAIRPAALRDHLREKLPAYMVPAEFIEVAAIPLTPNGKVDRRKLAETAPVQPPATESGPTDDDLESRIAKIWARLLNRQDIDWDEGFFDVGGDSVLAVTLAERIKTELDCAFSATALFQHPNVRAIAEYIRRTTKSEAPVAAEPVEVVSVPAKLPQRAAEPTPAPALANGYDSCVAIVGMSCQFPGAADHYAFWDNLRHGRESVAALSESELRALGVSEAVLRDPKFVASSATIDGKELFDPEFFKLSPLEAELLHPQLRLLLMHAWKAVEDAGYVSKSMPDCGVFMSSSNSAFGALSGIDAPDDASVLVKFADYQKWLLAQDGTIPTIISHRLGLRGPSYHIHSNCSSALVGLHVACQSVARGEVRQALVGAATLLPYWASGYLHQNGLNFSSNGHIRAFDSAADGMIGGEGVAVILVKNAADAIRDGDNIYAIVRGSAVNNDGDNKAGFYAPSVRGQADVISKAIATAGIPAETISYVEAHGTGTALGDPIEVAGLAEAFKRFTDKTGFCGLGSVKSNIGHTDTVAGLAGTIKVALALRQKEVPQTVNLREINPKLELDGSPFFIARENVTLAARDAPHRAAVSSFGIGGTNAHAIFEEPPHSEGAPRFAHVSGRPCLVPLSARNEARLKDYAKALLAFLADEDGVVRPLSGTPSLPDLAYTLQVGREAMETRLGIVATSLEDLTDKLRRILDGEDGIEGLYRGQAKRDRDAVALFAGDEEFAETLRRWIARGKLSKVLELWVKGLAIDWTLLYPDARPRRISLPTYPFARERFWVPKPDKPETVTAEAAVARLHPLLHRNTSDLWVPRFASTFARTDFFLADHVVQGAPVLPAVAYLEMARAAVALAAADTAKDRIVTLRNVVWARPLAVETDTQDVSIELAAEDDGAVAYEIVSPDPDGGEERLHGQGRVVLAEPTQQQPLDVASLRGACADRQVTAQECYALFERLGFGYGPAQQGLKTLHVGTDGQGRPQVLAQLELPACVADTQADYVLHPSILDAALQATVGLYLDSGLDKTTLPFAIEEVAVRGKSPARGWAWVRFAGASKPGDPVIKLDIDLCDQDGNRATTIRGFSARALDRDASASTTLLMRKEWRTDAVDAARTPAHERHWILICAHGARAREIEQAIKWTLPHARCIAMTASASALARRYEDAALQLLAIIKEAINDKSGGKILLQVIADGQEPLLSGLSGFIKTARAEHPALIGQLVHAGSTEPARLAELIKRDAAATRDSEVRYQIGQRHVARWTEIATDAKPASPWRDGGVYLITGGAGGLGLILAADIAKSAAQPTLVLAGRSQLGPEQESELQQLRDLGATVVYRQLDVADAGAVSSLVSDIVRDFDGLNGIIHGAGSLRDALIARKAENDVRAVLAPKVAGAVHLDEATRSLNLDLFVLHASVSGALGSVGQADYAAANAFLDAFAAYRNGLVAGGVCRGRTLAMNWPLWRDGGMRVDAGILRQRREQGLAELATHEGLEALYAAIASDHDQVLVLSGERERLLELVDETRAAEPEAPARSDGPGEAVPEPATDVEADRAIDYVKRLLSAVIKMPPDRIDADAALEQYGIDSVMAVGLTTELEKSFGSLSKTLFFEYQSLRALTEYLVQAHGTRLRTLIGAGAAAPKPAAAKELNGSAPKAPDAKIRRRTRPIQLTPAAPAVSQHAPLDVAVVGLSGRYPRARNIAEYWANLRDGRDCITEIPKDRWDHSLYFDPDRNAPGKTYGKWGGFIDGVDECDPLFFKISPREAERIDPQERLFLQCAYEALEDAGYTREGLRTSKTLGGNVGVYVGVMYEEYQLFGAQEQMRGNPVTLTGSPASIANRVSYFCNFHGPSMGIDTMCSSSLSAIHLACRDLQFGCDAAIAGGVNVSVHPNKYLFLGQFGFLSSEGQCASFGKGGDGYVPGEGVGAVLLKPLARAIADGDHIYGVIKATTVNHGGKTNGYTVPNPNAQADLIARAFRQAHIDPRTLSYIEAHGTGTSLGDPIEIAGLSKAFSEFTSDKQFCAIGSAKSNVGHCESAAGMAGLTKVLLQMKHRKLVPSLHSDTLNPNIDFSSTPFVVQRELADWQRPRLTVGGSEREIPRIAGISSFGAGGANAHVVVEEYIPADAHANPAIVVTQANPALVVLSAKNEQRLKEKIADLLSAIDADGLSDADLPDLAYTLQVGREAMETRLGVVATSLEDLTDKLRRFLDGEDGIEGLYRGQAKRDRDAVALFAGDEEFQETLRRWIARGKLSKVLELWVKGLAIDWTLLYPDARPRRISLPTYPFARERFWVPKPDKPETVTPEAAVSRLHPLLHRNTSDLWVPRFQSTFAKTDFFLADHVVQGSPVLPAVAYLEMARAAVATAAAETAKDRVITLRNVVWARPLAVETDTQDVSIELSAEDDGAIAYEIASPDPDGGEERLHGQGRVILAEPTQQEPLDISALRTACADREVAADACYALFERLGFGYGPAQQGLKTLHVGTDGQGRPQVLAQLELPACVVDTQADYVLHPSILDAALQATVGLYLDSGLDKTTLPFAIEEVAVAGPSPTRGWAWVRFAGASKPGDPVIKLDIDLCDQDGNLSTAIRGYSARASASDTQDDVTAKAEGAKREVAREGAVLLTPLWDVVGFVSGDTWPAASQRTVILGGSPERQAALRKHLPSSEVVALAPDIGVDAIAAALQAGGAFDHIVWLTPVEAHHTPDAESIVNGQQRGVVFGFRLVKALLKLGYGARDLGLTVVTTAAQAIGARDPLDPTHASVHGFLGTAAKEYPNWKMRLVDVPGPDLPLPQLLQIPADEQGNAWAHRNGEWYRQILVPTGAAGAAESPYKDGGVYVVIGGAGGLGEAWTEHMIRRHKARVVWIGRREKDEAIDAKIARLGALGPAPLYVSADAGDWLSLERAKREIKQAVGEINGIIHSAIVLQDKGLANMDERTFQSALAAKVDISVRIAQVFAGEALDFVVFFSSMLSFGKSAGQSNYAAGCTFKDAFARLLGASWPCKVKVMNWGFWGSTGIVATDAYKARMARLGVGSLETGESLAALETLLAAPQDQLAFTKTTRPLTAADGVAMEEIIAYPQAFPSTTAALQKIQRAFHGEEGLINGF